MRENLESLSQKIEAYLQENEIVIFRSEPRGSALLPGAVYWDTVEDSDFRSFVDAARALNVRLMTMHTTRFGEHDLEETLFLLSESSLSLEEKKEFERQLAPLDDYCGFVGRVELAFDFAARPYVFELTTEWFQEYEDLADQVESTLSELGASDPLSGFFPTNN